MRQKLSKRKKTFKKAYLYLNSQARTHWSMQWAKVIQSFGSFVIVQTEAGCLFFLA